MNTSISIVLFFNLLTFLRSESAASSSSASSAKSTTLSKTKDPEVSTIGAGSAEGECLECYSEIKTKGCEDKCVHPSECVQACQQKCDTNNAMGSGCPEPENPPSKIDPVPLLGGDSKQSKAANTSSHSEVKKNKLISAKEDKLDVLN